MSDKYFSSVVLLCGFNGADAATAFTDESSAARVATFVGNSQLDTAQKKFGTASLLLDGTGDYITFPNSTDLQVATGDLTIEAWIRRASTNTIDTITNKRDTTGAEEHSFYLDTVGALNFQAFNSSAVVSLSDAGPILANVWYHVAVSRVGSTWYLHRDGILRASGNQSGAPATNTSAFIIGRDGSNTGRDFNGWIDEVRMTKGQARYGAENFALQRGPFDRIKNVGVSTDNRTPILLMR